MPTDGPLPETSKALLDGPRALRSVASGYPGFDVDRADRVVSRDEILRSVWHTDHEGSNVIEAAISSLRRKLGP